MYFWCSRELNVIIFWIYNDQIILDPKLLSGINYGLCEFMKSSRLDSGREHVSVQKCIYFCGVSLTWELSVQRSLINSIQTRECDSGRKAKYSSSATITLWFWRIRWLFQHFVIQIPQFFYWGSNFIRWCIACFSQLSNEIIIFAFQKHISGSAIDFALVVFLFQV